MDKPLEDIYYRAPVAIQNALISLYGLRLRRERYSRVGTSYLGRLLESERLGPAEMQQLVDREFCRVVRDALLFVPFWRDWAASNHATGNDFHGIRDLHLLPVLKKDEIRSRPDRFLSDRHRHQRGLIRLETSGTSGTPLTVFCDRATRTHHYAFFSRLRHWFRLDARSRRATLFGRVIMRADDQNPPFWRYDAAQKNLLMSSYHLAWCNLGKYYEKLRSYAPEEIIGYPSSVYQLARYINEMQLPRLTPRVVITTAETLLPTQRETMESAFTCPIIDQYGCTEMAFFVSQCEHGSMHVHPEHGFLEAVDADGESVPSGVGGSCLATGFVNTVMPLLRYEIGDLIRLSDMHCPCGRAFPVLDEVLGRIDDVITTPDGRPLGRLDPVFKGRSGILECQVVQTAPAALELNVVANESFDAEAEADLLREMRKRAGTAMHVVVNRVDRIPKGKNGKFRSVVRNY